ncbi:Amino acid permease [Candidatus Magnetomoraceae bacterium gMMP-15]
MKNKLNNNVLQRDIGLFSATILVIANMIGTGIFTTSGFIIKEVGTPQNLLMCWLVGGIFALCGALCYAELGAAFPKAGGEYVFLRESFGKCMGFISGWISLIVGFSAPIAAASVAFSSYFLSAFSISSAPVFTLNLFQINLITISPASILAICVIILISFVHYQGLVIGSKFQNSLTIFKIGLILILIAAGIIIGGKSSDNLSQSFDFIEVFNEKFAVSLIFVSFAYSGWNAVAYLGGEIKNPKKNIPFALITGTIVVMCLYLCLNFVYISALSVNEMSGAVEIGSKTAVSLFGENISRFFGVAIAVSILSVLSAMIMTGPRVYYAMSKDGVFFKAVGKVNKLRKTPVYSIFLQAGIASLMVITASFGNLLLYIGFTLSLCAMFTVIGMIILRHKNPSLSQNYKTIGYPITPLLFILGNLWIIYYSVKEKPITSLYGILTIFAGVLVYLAFQVKHHYSS